MDGMNAPWSLTDVADLVSTAGESRTVRDLATVETIDTGPSHITELAFRDLEPSRDLGTMPVFAWLPKEALRIDPRYQRNLSDKSKTQIRRMVERWRWDKCQPLTVTEIDGVLFAVVDGQHRAAAALLHPKVEELPCWIITTTEVKEQAKVFVAVNAERTPMTTLQLFRGKLIAGDPDAVQVLNVCTRSGIEIAYHISNTTKRLPPRHTQSVATIRKLIAKHGERPVVRGLSSLASAYREVPDQLRGPVIEAVVTLVATYRDRLDEARLEKALAGTDCTVLCEQASKMRKLVGLSVQDALIASLVKAYDRGLPDAKRLNPQVA
ncbi:DUF6551 family protein [Azospirillum doebereinerae]|uniref:Uncharacterized protein n=1 Tax=Azospirillum doebereinerae TaxID=92933 RepID=A0A433J226_9PROT|nr:DUF6551 family protein [Azospirillum doebereinerae]RUQ65151.1 hypothetical protein EJ913_25740 [Azospirillum doebereinerae]